MNLKFKFPKFTVDDERWITISGEHVLIKGTQGSYVVKGGAGGKLDGLKVTPGSMSEPVSSKPTPAAKETKAPASTAVKEPKKAKNAEPKTPKVHIHVHKNNKKTASDADPYGFSKHHASLTKEQTEEIKRYKTSSSALNSRLRDTSYVANTTSKRMSDKRTDRLLDEVTDHKLTNPLTVYRGVVFKAESLKPGMVFSDRGYWSTSLSPDVAATFATKQGSEDNSKAYVFRINLKQGQKGHYIDTEKNSNEHEKEVLLPRGNKYKITKMQSEGKTAFIDLEVL